MLLKLNILPCTALGKDIAWEGQDPAAHWPDTDNLFKPQLIVFFS